MFLSYTIHSESSAFVPADAVQSAFPYTLFDLRTNVWSFVPSAIPATAQPAPGSTSGTPMMSMSVHVVSVPEIDLFSSPRASSPL